MRPIVDHIRYVIITALAIICNVCIAQKTILVKPDFKPNTTYIINSVIKDSVLVTVTGSEETLNRLKAGSGKLGGIMLTEVTIEIKTIVASHRSDGRLPVEMVFLNSTSKNTFNEQTNITTEGTGARVFGSYDSDMIITIDSIVGKNFSISALQKVRRLIESSNDFKYPRNPIKVGESFEQNAPIKIPLEGGAEGELIVTLAYQLKEIKNNKGLFNVKSTITSGIHNENAKLTSTGMGTGTAEFDIEKKIMSKLETTSVTETTMHISDFIVHSKGISVTSQKIVILK